MIHYILVNDFKLPDTNGKLISLDQYPESKGFIIIFTCNHCPYAVAYEDRILALSKKYNTNYPLIAISSNDPINYPQDSFDNMKIRAKEKQFNFPYLFDETQQVAQNFKATKTPHAFVIHKELNGLNMVYQGSIDDNWENPNGVEKKYIEQVIEDLITNKEITFSNTNPVGCTIKWK